MDLKFPKEKIVSNRSLYFLGAAIAAIGINPAAHAQASTPPRAPAAQAKPAAPAARAAPKPVSRADIVRDINANYKAMDTNSDGGVDAAEIQAAQARAQQVINTQFAKRRNVAFKQLDTNKDGQLSPAEFNAGSPPPRLKRAAPAAYIQQLDSDKDQKISPVEFAATRLANFDQIDANRDGVASLDELQKARAAQRR
jgi:hypothetical protein